MDKDSEKAKLEEAQAVIQEWLDNPITKELLRENEEQQQALIHLITDFPVEDFRSAAALVEAKGHLRGLRRWKGLVTERLGEIESQLKELE